MTDNTSQPMAYLPIGRILENAVRVKTSEVYIETSEVWLLPQIVQSYSPPLHLKQKLAIGVHIIRVQGNDSFNGLDGFCPLSSLEL